MRQVAEWLGAPGAQLLSPTARHGDVSAGLMPRVGTGGNLVSDAHVAALAVEHRVTVVSYDSDFGRFHGVRWQTPEDILR